MTDPVPTRRSMLTYATGGVLAVGAVGLARPLLGNWAPAGDTRATFEQYRADFDVADLQPDGQRILRIMDPDYGWKRSLRVWRVPDDFDIPDDHPGLSPSSFAPNARYVVTGRHCATDGMPLMRTGSEGTDHPYLHWCNRCTQRYTPDGRPLRVSLHFEPLHVPEIEWGDGGHFSVINWAKPAPGFDAWATAARVSARRG